MKSHFARVVLLALLGQVVEKGFAQQSQPNVNWLAPAKGDAFVAGDTITIKWENNEVLTSPVILLCYSSRGEGPSKQDCAPQTYPQNENGPGTHTLDITLPAVLSQDTFTFIIGDAANNKYISPPFSIRPESVTPVKVSDVLPTTTPPPASSSAPIAAAALPTSTDLTQEAIFGKPTPHEVSARIGLGTSFAIIGVFLLAMSLCICRRHFRHARNKKVFHAETAAALSRWASLTSSVAESTMDHGDKHFEEKTSQNNKGDQTATNTTSILPRFHVAPTREPSAEKNTSTGRTWLPPIPRVWRFYGEDKATPGMVAAAASQASQASSASFAHSSHPPSLRPGHGSNGSVSTSTHYSGASSSMNEPEHIKVSPSISDCELLETPPKAYHPESIGAAMNNLRKREKD